MSTILFYDTLQPTPYCSRYSHQWTASTERTTPAQSPASIVPRSRTFLFIGALRRTTLNCCASQRVWVNCCCTQQKSWITSGHSKVISKNVSWYRFSWATCSVTTISHERLEQQNWLEMFTSPYWLDSGGQRSKVKVTAGLNMWWRGQPRRLWGAEAYLTVYR